MKIASVFFDDIVVIPGAKDGGSAVPPQDLRESSFHARDGWAITMEPHGVFRLFREPMKGPCTVGGYGFTIMEELPEVAVHVLPPQNAATQARMRKAKP